MSDESVQEALDKADRLLNGEKPVDYSHPAFSPDPNAWRIGEEKVRQEPLFLVKVQYYSEKTGELSPREYTYFSEDTLAVGDIVIVPVRDTTGKAKVSSIDVPDAEIEAFRDKVKVIPAGSVVEDKPSLPAGGLAEAAQKAGAEVTWAEINYGPGGKGANTYLDRSTDELEEGLNSEGLTLFPEETAVALRPGEDLEVRSYSEQAKTLLMYAEGRNIITLEDNKVANDDLVLISKLKKLMEAKKREYLDPLRVQAEAIRETYSTLMDPILAADKITRTKMLAYSAEQSRIRAAQEEINRKRLEAAQEEMRLKGELSESVNLVEVQPEVSKRVSTDMGSSGQRGNWQWEVTDINQVPREYLMINAGMLTPIVKASKGKIVIPGVSIFNNPIIATRAR